MSALPRDRPDALPVRVIVPLSRRLSSSVTSMHVGVAQAALSLVTALRSCGCGGVALATLQAALETASGHWCAVVADAAAGHARGLLASTVLLLP